MTFENGDIECKDNTNDSDLDIEEILNFTANIYVEQNKMPIKIGRNEM
jgi:hypothetical protein